MMSSCLFRKAAPAAYRGPPQAPASQLIELTGTSKTSVEEAVQGAIIEAAKTVRNMSWFEVIETRGAIKDGKVDQWQVTVKVGFRIES